MAGIGRPEFSVAASGLRWWWASVLVLGADRLTKALALRYLDSVQPLELAPMLNLVLAHNTGAAFSLLSDAGGWQRWLFTGLAVAVSGMILVWLRHMPATNRMEGVALALVLGGALGNLWDRVAWGAVVDFVDVHYGGWHWPAFNVADSAITVGAVALVITALRPGRG